MKIGDKIRKMRDLKGLSQENMADALNLSISAYGKIERNETDVTFSKLQDIAKILEVQTTDIIKFDEQSYFINSFDNKAENNQGSLIFNNNSIEFIERLFNDITNANSETIKALKEVIIAKEEVVKLQTELIKSVNKVK